MMKPLPYRATELLPRLHSTLGRRRVGRQASKTFGCVAMSLSFLSLGRPSIGHFVVMAAAAVEEEDGMTRRSSAVAGHS